MLQNNQSETNTQTIKPSEDATVHFKTLYRILLQSTKISLINL